MNGEPAVRPAPGAGRTPAAPPARSLAAGIAGPSRLTVAAQAEYHYVGRDLRNIGVLVVLIVALLAAAFVIVNVSGVAPH